MGTEVDADSQEDCRAGQPWGPGNPSAFAKLGAQASPEDFLNKDRSSEKKRKNEREQKSRPEKLEPAAHFAW